MCRFVYNRYSFLLLMAVKDLALGLFRSDYMVHVDPTAAKPEPCIRQVEFNTIASSFGGLSSRVSQLHKYAASTHVEIG
jgi:glutathione synthase